MIAQSTGCGGCEEIVTVLADELEVQEQITRDKQRELGQARSTITKRAGRENVSVREIIGEWRRVFPEHKDKAAEPKSTRWKMIEARLAGGVTVEQAKLAVHGAKVNSWNQGKGRNGQPRTDIDCIFFSEKMVEDLAVRGAEPREVPRGVGVLLAKLGDVQRLGEGRWKARCPAHEDARPSLDVRQAEDRVLVVCRVGCTTEDVLAAVGLGMATLFDRTDDPPRPVAARVADALPTEDQLAAWGREMTARPKLLERLEALRGWKLEALTGLGVGWDPGCKRLVLPIRDAEGALVNVLRYTPSPKGGESKMLSTKGRKRDLFPAPETVGDAVWLAEGEPDAISGKTLGLPVVGVPGSNGWRDEWAPRFSGRRVVVCFDCDEPGRSAAGKVARSVAVAAAEVRVLDLDPGRADGFDLGEALRTGWSRVDLEGFAGSVRPVLRLVPGEAA